MNSLFFALSVSAVLSVSSLLIVLFRISPLTAEKQALTAFFISCFLSIITAGTLLLYYLWNNMSWHHWDRGKILTTSFRQSVFLACACCLTIFFHLQGLLNWWIALITLGIFVLIEVALDL